jgi:hypothetical protein
VLQTDQIDAVDIEEVGGAAIRVNILLRQFKANAGRIGVAGLDIVDGQGNAGGVIYSVAMASHRSVVKVAIPHWRGK